MTEHVPRRPTWLCRTCSVEWPCQPARSLLPLECGDNRIGLYRLLGVQLYDAAIDLYQLNPNPGPDPKELYERFLGWVLIGDPVRGSARTSLSGGPLVTSLRANLPADNHPSVLHANHKSPHDGRPVEKPAAGEAADQGRAYAGAPGSFGALVSKLRLSRGWSQQRVAEDLCAVSGLPTVTRNEVSRWERQQRIPGDFWLGHLATVLKCPVGQLEAAAAVARTNPRSEAPGSRADSEVVRARRALFDLAHRWLADSTDPLIDPADPPPDARAGRGIGRAGAG